jgi:hypothetical protein
MSSSVRVLNGRFQPACLLVGIVALAISLIGGFSNPRQFFFSYLFGWFFWVGLSFGCFVVTMIHQLTGGRWGYPIRRILEAGFMVLPVMLILFIPLLFGLKYLYPWAQSAELTGNHVLEQRHGYQNQSGFIIRGLIFFVVTIWMGWCLRRWSLQQDATSDAAPTRKARTLSGPGVVLFSLLATFVYVDWIMSLEKEWHSTMFPVILLIGQILIAYAFSVVMLTLFGGLDPFATILTKTHYHHLGNLLLTFVLFWTYISFGQLLIVYAGDLPTEIDWYLHRIAGGWKCVVGALALLHFFVPFFLLLFRGMKRHASALGILAAIIFVMHIMDAYWLVMPSLHPRGIAVSWLDFLTPLGFGGIWLAVFLSRLKAAALAPQNDPGMQFAFVYGH